LRLDRIQLFSERCDLLGQLFGLCLPSDSGERSGYERGAQGDVAGIPFLTDCD
jgi:hypothetical protein